MYQGEEIQGFTFYAPNMGKTAQYSRIPKEGDIFRSREADDVLFLDFVSTANSQEHYSVQSPGYSGDSLYRVHEGNGGVLLLRIGEYKLAIPEDNKTVTYYLPDEDIALRFTSVPKDGDIFSSQRNDNVVILDVLPTENFQEHHKLHSSAYSMDKELYRVQQGDGVYLLMKMNNKNMPTEVAYSFGGTTHEGNKNFTCYIDDMVFHFTRVPNDGDIFSSRRSHNVMILDIFLMEDFQEHQNLSSSVNRWDGDLYRVEEGKAGSILVKTTYDEVRRMTRIYEDIIRRYLRTQKKIASSNRCDVCLDAYENDDGLESLCCGHKYHVSCIKTWLQQRSFCPICLIKVTTSE